MGLLSGDGAAMFGQLLAPLYLNATLTSHELAYDGKGTLTRAATPDPLRVQVDRCTEKMITAEGYTATDRAIYILATSHDGDVDTDTEILVEEGPYAGTKYTMASPIERDPCGAYWLCRGVQS